MITFQATLIAKEIGKYKSGNLSDGSIRIISDFLGVSVNDWQNLNKEEILKEFYINRIRKYKPFVLDIVVKGKTSIGGTFKYYLIFASGKKNPPWRSWIEYMKRFVENFTGDIVEASLLYLEGKISRISEYSKDNSLETHRESTKLDDFY